MKEGYGKDVTIQNVTEILAEIGDVDAIVVGWDLKLTAVKITVAAAIIQLNKDIRLITCSSDKGGVLGITPKNQGLEKSWEDKQLRHMGNGTMTSAVCECA